MTPNASARRKMVGCVPDYEYRGKMAELWDFFRGDTSRWADRFFYRELIERVGQPALDVGCGTGRILIDLMLEGIDIDGVDNSPEMLDLCRQKCAAIGLTPRLFEQQMELLDLPRRYKVILIPSSSIQLVTNPDAARRALQRFHDHLLPGGAIAASIMTLWIEGEPLDSGWSIGAEKVRESDGLLLRRWQRSLFNPSTSVEDTEDRYETLRDGVIVDAESHARASATRSYTQEQARRLFTDAGFSDVVLHSEFTWEPVQPSDRLFTVIGRTSA